jgi:hypothetical protein
MRVDSCEASQAAVDAACEEFEKRFPVPLDGSFRPGVEAVLAAALAAMPESPSQLDYERLCLELRDARATLKDERAEFAAYAREAEQNEEFQSVAEQLRAELEKTRAGLQALLEWAGHHRHRDPPDGTKQHGYVDAAADVYRQVSALLKPTTPEPQAAPVQSTPPVVQPGEALVRAEALAQVYALLDVLAQSYADYLGCRARGAANKDSARGMLDSFVVRWCATRGPA